MPIGLDIRHSKIAHGRVNVANLTMHHKSSMKYPYIWLFSAVNRSVMIDSHWRAEYIKRQDADGLFHRSMSDLDFDGAILGQPYDFFSRRLNLRFLLILKCE